MSARPNNPYAFPNNDSACIERNGMTLRDWFAGQALPGVIPLCCHDTATREIGHAAHYAAVAYEIADAMLAARGDAS